MCVLCIVYCVDTVYGVVDSLLCVTVCVPQIRTICQTCTVSRFDSRPTCSLCYLAGANNLVLVLENWYIAHADLYRKIS